MMPNMIGFEFGDIVLLSFPFTNYLEAKKRPAVVISSDAYHQYGFDVILMAITSQIKVKPAFAEVPIENWQAAGLLKRSIIKPVMFTVEKNLIQKKLGRLADEDVVQLRRVLKLVIS